LSRLSCTPALALASFRLVQGNRARSLLQQPQVSSCKNAGGPENAPCTVDTVPQLSESWDWEHGMGPCSGTSFGTATGHALPRVPIERVPIERPRPAPPTTARASLLSSVHGAFVCAVGPGSGLARQTVRVWPSKREFIFLLFFFFCFFLPLLVKRTHAH